MSTRVIADWIPDGKGGGRTRYTLAIYGGIVTELTDFGATTNALFAYNLDMVTAPGVAWPDYYEEVTDPKGAKIRRPAPLWLASSNVQDGINQSQQAVRGGA